MDTNTIHLSLQLVLPVFNEFAERAKLDVPLPLVTQRVTKFHNAKYSSTMMMTFDNQYRFVWRTMTNTEKLLIGTVTFDDHQQNVTRMDREKMYPILFHEKSLIGTNEAVLIASNCLVRLGYYNTNYFKTPPVVRQYAWSEDLYDANPKQPLKPLPYFDVFWPPVTPSGLDASFGDDYAFRIQVSGLSKKVVVFSRLMTTPVAESQSASSVEQLRMFETCPIPMLSHKLEMAQPP